jgi:hypothetical protein
VKSSPSSIETKFLMENVAEVLMNLAFESKVKDPEFAIFELPPIKTPPEKLKDPFTAIVIVLLFS